MAGVDRRERRDLVGFRCVDDLRGRRREEVAGTVMGLLILNTIPSSFWNLVSTTNGHGLEVVLYIVIFPLALAPRSENFFPVAKWVTEFVTVVSTG